MMSHLEQLLLELLEILWEVRQFIGLHIIINTISEILSHIDTSQLSPALHQLIY